MYSRYVLPVLVLGIASLISACGDDKPEKSEDTRVQGLLLEVQLESAPGQLHLQWNRDDTADVLFSTDAQCNWQNYTQCPDSGILADQTSPVLIEQQDGFEKDRSYYFAVNMAGQPMQFVEGRLTAASEEKPQPDVADVQGLSAVLATVEGDVLALVRDEEERWYIGGLFRSIVGQPIRNLARLKADGRLDTAWQVSPDATVTALTVMGERLYVGGDFKQIADKERTRLAAFDLASDRLTGWQPQTNLAVIALAADNGMIYAGGWFTFANDQVRHRIASFTATGEVTADFKPLLNGHVSALAVKDGTVYASGGFTLINEIARKHLAALDADTGRLLPWNPGLQGNIQSLLINNNKLYAGGSFSAIAGEPYSKFAVFDLFDGELAETVPDHQGLSVNAMAMTESELYLFGQSGQAGRQLLVLETDSVD